MPLSQISSTAVQLRGSWRREHPLVVLVLSLGILLLPRAFAGNRERDLQELIEAESLFNLSSLRLGFGDAIKAFVAKDGVSITMAAQGPDALRRAFRNQPLSARLAWSPVRVDVAASGDLGYCVGTWVLLSDGTDRTPKPKTGIFLTVWARDANGRWRVASDGGGRPMDGATLEAFANQMPIPATTAVEPIAPDSNGSAGNLDALLATAQSSAGANEVDVATLLDENIVLLDRAIIGRDAAAKAIASNPRDYLAVQVLHARQSAAGDMAFYWGVAPLRSDGESARQDLCVAVWRRSGDGTWKLLIFGRCEHDRATIDALQAQIEKPPTRLTDPTR